MSTVALHGLCLVRPPSTEESTVARGIIVGYPIEVNTETARVTVLMEDGSIESLQDLKVRTGWGLVIEHVNSSTTYWT